MTILMKILFRIPTKIVININTYQALIIYVEISTPPSVKLNKLRLISHAIKQGSLTLINFPHLRLRFKQGREIANNNLKNATILLRLIKLINYNKIFKSLTNSFRVNRNINTITTINKGQPSRFLFMRNNY